MKIIQQKLSPAKWIQHFKEQAMGVRHPTRDGYTFVNNQVGKGSNSERSSSPPPIKLVSPVQQVVEQARAEIKREGRGIKRKSFSIQPQFKKKPRRGKTSASASKKKPKKTGSIPKRVKARASTSKKSRAVSKKKRGPRDIFGK